MAKDGLSRRELMGAATAAALLPTIASAHQAASPDEADVTAKLAAPLDAKAKELLGKALTAGKQAADARLKFPLPENSEPCTTYYPSPVKERKR